MSTTMDEMEGVVERIDRRSREALATGNAEAAWAVLREELRGLSVNDREKAFEGLRDRAERRSAAEEDAERRVRWNRIREDSQRLHQDLVDVLRADRDFLPPNTLDEVRRFLLSLDRFSGQEDESASL